MRYGYRRAGHLAAEVRAESTTIARYTVMGVDATHGGRDLLHVSSRQKAVNRAHARIRALGERPIATLKTWKILV